MTDISAHFVNEEHDELFKATCSTLVNLLESLSSFSKIKTSLRNELAKSNDIEINCQLFELVKTYDQISLMIGVIKNTQTLIKSSNHRNIVTQLTKSASATTYNVMLDFYSTILNQNFKQPTKQFTRSIVGDLLQKNDNYNEALFKAATPNITYVPSTSTITSHSAPTLPVQIISTFEFLNNFEKTAFDFSIKSGLHVNNVWEHLFTYAVPENRLWWVKQFLINKNLSWKEAKAMYFTMFPDPISSPAVTTPTPVPVVAPAPVPTPVPAPVPTPVPASVVAPAIASKPAVAPVSVTVSTPLTVPAPTSVIAPVPAVASAPAITSFSNPTSATISTPAATPTLTATALPYFDISPTIDYSAKRKLYKIAIAELRDLSKSEDRVRVSKYGESILSLEMKTYESIDEYNLKYLRYCMVAQMDLNDQALVRRYINSLFPKYRQGIERIIKTRNYHFVDLLEMLIFTSTVITDIEAKYKMNHTQILPYKLNCVHQTTTNNDSDVEKNLKRHQEFERYPANKKARN